MLYTRKINERGEYLPFYGYTTISMLDPRQNLQQIEKFIHNSSIGKYFSPLPSDTYHMTLFNIYSLNSKPIEPVEKWLQEGGTLPKQNWLPFDVLNVEHIKASHEIRKVKSRFKVQNLKLYCENTIGIHIQLGENDTALVSELRKKLASIYKHDDPHLRLHVTFGYRFKQFPTEEIEKNKLKNDLSLLMNYLKLIITDFSFQDPDIYLFNSMTNFLPYTFFYSSLLPS